MIRLKLGNMDTSEIYQEHRSTRQSWGLWYNLGLVNNIIYLCVIKYNNFYPWRNMILFEGHPDDVACSIPASVPNKWCHRVMRGLGEDLCPVFHMAWMAGLWCGLETSSHCESSWTCTHTHCPGLSQWRMDTWAKTTFTHSPPMRYRSMCTV